MKEAFIITIDGKFPTLVMENRSDAEDIINMARRSNNPNIIHVIKATPEALRAKDMFILLKRICKELNPPKGQHPNVLNYECAREALRLINEIEAENGP